LAKVASVLDDSTDGIQKMIDSLPNGKSFNRKPKASASRDQQTNPASPDALAFGLRLNEFRKTLSEP
jgi:hypothetical protein